MDEMIQKLSIYPNETFLRMILDNGKTIIDGTIDTIYETDNGKEEDTEEYEEFYACAFRVKKIIKHLGKDKLGINQLIEISKFNPPISIALKDGTIIWKRQV